MIRMTATMLAALAAISLSACTQSDKTSGAGSPTAAPEITVQASDTGCVLSATQSSTGPRTFVITNTGTKVTEFYVYGAGQRVLAEAENISPGLQRRLEVTFDEPGTYQTACKPDMVGDGIRGDFVVKA